MSKKYVIVDECGVVTHRLSDSVHVIPKNAKPITDDQWAVITQGANGAWVLQADGSFVFVAPEAPEVNVSSLISSTRYNHEITGIKVNGFRIDTDRESQALITGAALSAILDGSYVCTWKSVDGPVQLSAADLLMVASAVRAHVQACFNRECELLKSVSDGTYTDAMLTEGWPV